MTMDEGQACVDTDLTLELSLGLGGEYGSVRTSSAGGGGMKRKKPFAMAPSVEFHAQMFPILHNKQEDDDEGQRPRRGGYQDFSYRDDGSTSTRSVGDVTAKSRSDHHDKEDSADDGTNRGGASASSAASRKKLRLSTEQSATLEETFRQHPTLNPAQKLQLAEKLKLLPRQVEVWFQNRRARTKLKQTEVDLEFLRRCCAALTDENTRLKEELHELKSAMAVSDNPRPSTGCSTARPRKMAAASCASCMTAVETPSASCSGGEGGGVTILAVPAAGRPIGLHTGCAPSKMAR